MRQGMLQAAARAAVLGQRSFAAQAAPTTATLFPGGRMSVHTCPVHFDVEQCTPQVQHSRMLTCTLYAAGDGIGPEIADAVKKVFTAANVPVQWEEQIVGTTPDPRTNSMVSRENLDSVLVRPHCTAHPAIRTRKALVNALIHLQCMAVAAKWLQCTDARLPGA